MSILEAINEMWAWTISAAVAVEAVSPFGNVVVRCEDGGFYRIMPDDLKAVPLGPGGFSEAIKQDDFREDWEMSALVSAARDRLGPNPPGRCYGFRMWPLLGGKYAPENIVSKDLVQWLRVSGDVAQQAASLPDGARVRIKVV